MSQTEHDAEPVAAIELEPDASVRCSFDDCEKLADFFVEWQWGLDGAAGSEICSDCSRSELIWVRENDLLLNEVAVER